MIFYSKDFETQDIAAIGQYDTFDEADIAAGENSDWIFTQDSLEQQATKMILASVNRFPVYVVTCTNDYELVSQEVFLCREAAEDKFIKTVNGFFEKDFSTEDQCREFLCSEEWWDNDARIAVHLEDVGIDRGPDCEP